MQKPRSVIGFNGKIRIALKGYSPWRKTRAKTWATSRPVRGSCRRVKGGTRCHHIINQPHEPIDDAVTLVLGHGERACQIVLSLASTQYGLCWASRRPRQCFGGKDASFILLT